MADQSDHDADSHSHSQGSEQQDIFEVTVERKLRRTDGTTYYQARELVCHGQDLEVYYGENLKGMVSLADSTTYNIPADHAQNKLFRFVVESAVIRIIFNAVSDPVRQQCVSLFNLAASTPEWTLDQVMDIDDPNFESEPVEDDENDMEVDEEDFDDEEGAHENDFPEQHGEDDNYYDSEDDEEDEEDDEVQEQCADLDELKTNTTNLLQQCKAYDGQLRVDALNSLWDISFVEAHREILCAFENFLPTLAWVMENASHDPQTIEKCTGVLWCLSATPNCRLPLCAEVHRLVPLLLQATTINGMIKTNVTNILLNCSIDSRTHGVLLAPEHGYLDYLKASVEAEPDAPIYYNAFQCLFTDISREQIAVVVTMNIHDFIMRKLISCGHEPEFWGEIGKRCLNILMYLSRYPESAEGIRQLKQRSFLYSLLEDYEINGIKACFIVANCYGKEEGNATTRSFLEERATALPMVTSCLDANINYDPKNRKIKALEAKGYVIGVIQLNVISSALKNLSLIDRNKSILLEDRKLLADLLHCIQVFIDNGPQFGGYFNNMYRMAGGGGDDLFSVENFLELILQLSYQFVDDASLAKDFNVIKGYKISQMLKSLLELPEERRVTFEMKQIAVTLLQRYERGLALIPAGAMEVEVEEDEFEEEKREAKALLRVCRQEKGKARVEALADLWDMLYLEENRMPLCEPSLNLVETMIWVLKDAHDDPLTVEKCIGGLWCLSSSHECRMRICNETTDLLAALLAVVHHQGKVRENATNILLNCSVDGKTHDYLMSPGSGYLDYLKRSLDEEPDSGIYYNSFQCLFTEIHQKYLPVVIEKGLVEFMANKLVSGGTNPAQWGEIPKRCLNILMYLSRYPEGAQALREQNQSIFVTELMKDKDIQGIKAFFLAANCYGREETDSTTKSFLEEHPTALPLITSCLEATIHYDKKNKKVKALEDKGFVIGVIQLNVISSSLKSIAIHAANRALLTQSRRLLGNILECLYRFINNGPQFGGMYNKMYRVAGGGGDDLFSVENFLELILQLSYQFVDDASLAKDFNVIKGYKISQMLKSLLELPEERRVTFEMKQIAVTLLQRYERGLALIPAGAMEVEVEEDEFEEEKREAKALLRVCRQEKGKARVEALADLWDMLYLEENRMPLCEPSLNLVETMIWVLKDAHDDPLTVEKCIGGLWCLSSSHECRMRICNETTDLLAALLAVVHHQGKVRENATNILLNCSVDGKTHDYLMSPGSGYLDYLKRSLDEEPDSGIYYNSFQCLFTEIHQKYLPVVIEKGLVEFMANKLVSGGTNPAQWGEIPKRCLNILMYLSRYPEGAQALREQNQSIFVTELMKDKDIQGIKAFFLAANCYGREETDSTTKSFLEEHPTALPLITSCLEATIHYDPRAKLVRSLEKRGFIIGVIQLNVLSSVLKNLAVSKDNRRLLVRVAALLADVLLCLQAFVEDRPQFGGDYNDMFRLAGGGGSDTFTVVNLLHMLHSLAADFDGDGALARDFDSFGQLRVSQLLEELLALPESRRLPAKEMEAAQELLQRYQRGAEEAETH